MDFSLSNKPLVGAVGAFGVVGFAFVLLAFDVFVGGQRTSATLVAGSDLSDRFDTFYSFTDRKLKKSN